jgi:hypothetical protein
MAGGEIGKCPGSIFLRYSRFVCAEPHPALFGFVPVVFALALVHGSWENLTKHTKADSRNGTARPETSARLTPHANIRPMVRPLAQSDKPNRVVVACLDGRRPKGYVYNFSGLRDCFHLFPAENSRSEEGTEMKFSALKAIFFVRSFEGNREHKDAYDLKAVGHGRRIEVTFSDGERILGTTEAYSPQKVGFFVFPADPESNNTRVFVINSNVQKLSFLHAECPTNAHKA